MDNSCRWLPVSYFVDDIEILLNIKQDFKCWPDEIASYLWLSYFNEERFTLAGPLFDKKADADECLVILNTLVGKDIFRLIEINDKDDFSDPSATWKFV